MTLQQVIANVDQLPSGSTLFVERVAGAFRSDSAVDVIEMTDDELNIPVREFATQRTPGKEYFLEVSVISEILDGLRSNKKLRKLSTEAIVDVVIYYAKNDAYPDFSDVL